MDRRSLALALFLVASVALARAGGGEKYTSPSKPSSSSPSSSSSSRSRSSSSSSSSSHSGGGGGKASPVAMGFLLLVGGGFLLFLKFAESRRRIRPVFYEADDDASMPPAPPQVPGLRTLMDRDLQFLRESFLALARRHFETLQVSWFRRDLGPSRAALSDATYQRFSTQLRLMAQQGLRDAIGDLRIIDAKLLSVTPGPHFDTIDVRFAAELRDGDAPASATDEEARALAARAPLERFTEVWTFSRSATATTKPASSGCPNCGAPFTGNATAQCTHCQAILNSGHFDWVVSEITQQAEAHAPSSAGLLAYEQRTPDFARAVLEDRAALIFWKWVEAHALGSAAPVAKLASPAYASALSQELERRVKQGLQRRMKDCAVGAVHTLTIETRDDAEFAFVEVRWSASNRPERTVLSLRRRPGASAAPARGLATCRCPKCSAPLDDNGQPTCAYCGEALGASATDWVLDALLTWEAWCARPRPILTAAAPSAAPPAAATTAAAPTAPPALAPPPQEALRLFQSVAAFAAVDGQVTEAEREHLAALATRWKVSTAELERALQGPFETPEIEARSKEAEVFLSALVDLTYADGYDATELMTLTRVAMTLGLAPQLRALLEAKKRG